MLLSRCRYAPRMNRRDLLRSALMLTGLPATFHRTALAGIPKMKIQRIRYYQPKNLNPTFNQSNRIVVVETDAGITGIGEGGSLDMMQQCASMLIGEDPARIDPLWQLMFRGWFYPPGREKLHALGALDVALWDIKGKALGVPVYDLLGGLARLHIECYSSGQWQGNIKDTVKSVMESGFRAYRTALGSPVNPQPSSFNPHDEIYKEVEKCSQIHEALGTNGDWLTDLHTRLDLADAMRLCTLLEPLAPYEVEDPLRSENPAILKELRSHVKVPIAVGEQYGARWDINTLIEQNTIDYSRITLPNAGGITEFLKIAALCDTHFIGLIPHFTGPISLAALTHTLGWYPGSVLMEWGGGVGKDLPYLPQSIDFHNGKLWPRAAPGIGVEFDPKGADHLADITERSAPIPIYRRPDGSMTNW